jgi:DEP domain-containing protein 5
VKLSSSQNFFRYRQKASNSRSPHHASFSDFRAVFSGSPSSIKRYLLRSSVNYFSINHDIVIFAQPRGSLLPMSVVPPSTPRRGTRRASHLRQVSNSGSDTPYNSRPMTATSDTGTVQHDPVPLKLSVERKCVLWVHDEGFSKDEVVLNLGLFPDVKPGELMAIVGLKTDISIRDFQEKGQGSIHELDALATSMQRERSNSNPRSPGPVNGSDSKHDADLGKRYLFIARDMPKEMKTRHPNLEVSVAKHIADVFCLKHRSNVLLTTVCLSKILF